MDAFATARFLLGGTFLCYAAVSDVRTRRVPLELWAILGGIAFVILVLELASSSADLDRYAVVGAAGILYSSLFIGAPVLDESGFHFRPWRFAGFAFAFVLLLVSATRAGSLGGPELVSYEELVSVPILVVLYQVLYLLRWIHGGADLLCFATLTILLPTYPNVAPLPVVGVNPALQSALSVLFPFSLVILIDSGIIEVVVVLLINLGRNVVHGDYGFPEMLIGYRVDLDRFPRFVWLIERVKETGEHYLVLLPKRTGDQTREVKDLQRQGMKRAWVQPQTPKMVYILIGFLVSLIVGNVFVAVLAVVKPLP